LLALGLLSGCAMVGPDFQPPEASVTEAWDVRDPSLKPESTSHRAWWKALQDPVLDALIERAYRQNLTLQAAGLRVLEARAILGIAVGSQYPQLQELSGSYLRTEQSRNSGLLGALPKSLADQADRDVTTSALGFDAAWELDFWGKFRRGVEAADANLLASVADYDDFLVTLTAEVASVYVRLRTLEQQLEYAQGNAGIQQRGLDITDVRFRNGITTELDVQQAKALLRNTQALVPGLQARIRQAKHGLSVLLGLPPGELAGLLGDRTGRIPAPPAEVAVGVPAELLRRRPDIRSAELAAAAQNARVGVAQADLYPRFSLVGSIGVVSDDLDDLLESDSRRSLIGPSFSWSVLNYGRIKNSVRAQDARLQALLVNYADTVLRAAREVEDAQIGFLRGQEQVVFLQDSVDASQRSVDLSLIQYRDGQADYTRVLNSQRFLLDQQEQFAIQRGNVVQELIAMYKALGGGWQIREGEGFIPESVAEQMRQRTDWGGLLGETDGDSAAPGAEVVDPQQRRRIRW
jgi:NodT family efflux transporter outer membrane factor (OMF) lipoprotein